MLSFPTMARLSSATARSRALRQTVGAASSMMANSRLLTVQSREIRLLVMATGAASPMTEAYSLSATARSRATPPNGVGASPMTEVRLSSATARSRATPPNGAGAYTILTLKAGAARIAVPSVPIALAHSPLATAQSQTIYQTKAAASTMKEAYSLSAIAPSWAIKFLSTTMASTAVAVPSTVLSTKAAAATSTVPVAGSP